MLSAEKATRPEIRSLLTAESTDWPLRIGNPYDIEWKASVIDQFLVTIPARDDETFSSLSSSRCQKLAAYMPTTKVASTSIRIMFLRRRRLFTASRSIAVGAIIVRSLVSDLGDFGRVSHVASGSNT